MIAETMLSELLEMALVHHCDSKSQVLIHIGNLLYNIDHIDTVIDMDTNKPNIVIHVKEK